MIFESGADLFVAESGGAPRGRESLLYRVAVDVPRGDEPPED